MPDERETSIPYLELGSGVNSKGAPEKGAWSCFFQLHSPLCDELKNPLP